MVPKIERERTTIPRTTPRLRVHRGSRAVRMRCVTNSCGTMQLLLGDLAAVDFDHRRIFDDDGLFQRVYDADGRAARLTRSLRRTAPPIVTTQGSCRKSSGPLYGGIEGQAVIGREGLAQRNADER